MSAVLTTGPPENCHNYFFIPFSDYWVLPAYFPPFLSFMSYSAVLFFLYFFSFCDILKNFFYFFSIFQHHCSATKSCPLFVTVWTAICQASLSFISLSLLKLMSIESMMSSNHLILCHPLLLLPSIFPSIRVFSNESGLFQWFRSLHQVAKVLELQIQHQSFLCIFRTDFLYNWVVWSPCCPRDSQESSLAPQIKGINSFLCSSSHIHTWLLEKP